jgi:hypothetical protein
LHAGVSRGKCRHLGPVSQRFWRSSRFSNHGSRICDDHIKIASSRCDPKYHSDFCFTCTLDSSAYTAATADLSRSPASCDYVRDESDQQHDTCRYASSTPTKCLPGSEYLRYDRSLDPTLLFSKRRYSAHDGEGVNIKHDPSNGSVGLDNNFYDAEFDSDEDEDFGDVESKMENHKDDPSQGYLGLEYVAKYDNTANDDEEEIRYECEDYPNYCRSLSGLGCSRWR